MVVIEIFVFEHVRTGKKGRLWERMYCQIILGESNDKRRRYLSRLTKVSEIGRF